MNDSIPAEILNHLIEADQSDGLVTRSNYEEYCSEVREIAEKAGKILSHPIDLWLAQNASFYALLSLRTPTEPDDPPGGFNDGERTLRLELSFSDYGRLVSVAKCVEGRGSPTETQLSELSELLKSYGFFPVSAQQVRVRYTGVWKTHDGRPMSDVDGFTWYDRFFNWI